MCDYSLEMYGSRPAREGERYVTTRFPSGSMGLASPGHLGTPVCMACDTRLSITDIPAELAARHGLPVSAEATFVRLDTGSYRDGLKFDNGAALSLQQLPAGISVAMAHELAKPVDIFQKADRKPALV